MIEAGSDPAGRRERRSEGAWLLASGLTGMTAALLPLLFSANPYFRSDGQAYFLPSWAAIGGALRHGIWPSITLQTWFGGNLLGEYQYGLGNPVSLLAAIAIDRLGDMAVATVCLVVFYNTILAAGTYRLARRCGAASPWAWLAALSFATNNFVYYWFACAWPAGLVATAWLVWAIDTLFGADCGRKHWLAAVACCALTFSAGWYFADLALILVIAAMCGVAVLSRAIASVVAPVLAAEAAGLLTLVLVLPTYATAIASSRNAGTFATSFLIPNLYGVLNLSSPDYRGFMPIFGDRHDIASPIFFAGWYLLPLLPLIDWSRHRWRPATLTLASLALVFLIASQGPDQIGPIRWPFRHLPYMQLSLVVLFAAIASEAGFAPPSRRRLWLSLGIVGFGAVASLQAHPDSALRLLVVAALAAAGAVYAQRFPPRRFAMIAALTLGFCVMTRAWHPTNQNVPAWPVAHDTPAVVALDAVPASYTLYLGTMFEPDFGRQSAAQLGLVHGIAEINGYSPIGQTGLSTELCMGNEGDDCEQAGALLMAPDPSTGSDLADLMRVDRLVVERGPHLDTVRPLLGADWRVVDESRTSVVITRAPPIHRPSGSVTWSSPGIELRETATASATRESIELAAVPSSGGRIIFARADWPGYRAELNGAELPVTGYRKLFVEVDLPAGSAPGDLVLRHEIPYWRWGAAAMVLGLLLIAAVLVRFPRRTGIAKVQG